MQNFIKIVRAVFEILAKNIQKWGFFPKFLMDFFLRDPALSLLYPYGTLTSCKKLGKTNEES